MNMLRHCFVRPLLAYCFGLLLVIIALLCSSLPQRSSLARASATYSNPVFTRDFPDPMVLRVATHNYYAYATTTGWEVPGAHFPILHSTDLVHWHYIGDMFGQDPGWATGDYWAPSLIARAGIYYAYYVGLKGSHCVAVATAKAPAGPFTTRGVIGCGDATGTGYIDPAPFIDVNGKAYLYLSVDAPEHTISVIPLAADLLHAAGPRRMLFGLTQSWEHGQNFSTVEGPFLIRHGTLYYLFYSGNDWNGAYAMGYATSHSPTGPFLKCLCNPILHSTGDVLGPGGGSLVQGPDSREWLIFHAWDDGGVEGYSSGGVRNLLLEPLTWRATTVSVHQPTNAPQSIP